ncbi:hypothetical protein V7138_14935 [Bacillus sp. JJ1533]|uniref:hypothetical protein n=1 Tax=Bacillus sp. JJ1533 TaxID=3122959 RepID=UPI002FFECE3B
MALKTINVPIGPAKVEFGDSTPTIFDVTKGGVVFSVSSTKQDITIDQYGDTPVKSIFKGRTAQVTVPMAEYDLKKLSVVTPNSKFGEDVVDPEKPLHKLEVYANAGDDLTSTAKKLVIKPTAKGTSENDWVTIPLAAPMADIEYTYNSDNERIANVTFVAYPDEKGLLYFMGDSLVTIS